MKPPTNLKRRGTTLAGIFGAGAMSLLLLCGAGLTPTGNVMTADVNAAGHNLTNAATVRATNVIVTGSLTVPTGFTLPYTNVTGAPTIPTAVSQLTNDASYVTAASAPVRSVNGQTGVVSLTIPTNDNQLTNGASYVTAAGAATAAPVQSVAGRAGTIVLAASDISGLAASATTDTTSAANITSGTLSLGRIPIGTTSSTVAAGNDARFPASVTGIRLGNGAGGSDTALALGTGLSLTSGTLNSTSGTVSSVSFAAPTSIFSASGSPVTSSGTLTLGLLNQSANLVWAGPSTGSAAAPTFRSLVTADLPTSVTAQGNSFNGNSQLVQTTSAGALPALNASGVTNLHSYTAESLSAASTGTITNAGRVDADFITLAAGTAAYTVNKILSATGAQVGDLKEIPVSYPASTNPTINFYDTSTSGTLLIGVTGTATAGTTTYQFGFDGAHWNIFPKGAVLQKNLGTGTYAALLNAPNVTGGMMTVGGGLYESPLTFSTGLTRTGNTVAVNAAQALTSLTTLTTDGILYTSGGTGTLNTGWTLAPDSSATTAVPVSWTAGAYTGSGTANSGGAVNITGGATSGTTLSSLGGTVNITGGAATGSQGYGGGVNIQTGINSNTSARPIINIGTVSSGTGASAPIVNIGVSGDSGITQIQSGNTYINSPSILIKGTAAVGNASAGYVGEYIKSLIPVGSAASLTSATSANVTSINLSAGDWDVEGSVNFAGTTATTSQFTAGISTTSATLPTDGSEVDSYVPTTSVTGTNGMTIPRARLNVSTTTTVYLVGNVTFSAGSEKGYGTINARRVR